VLSFSQFAHKFNRISCVERNDGHPLKEYRVIDGLVQGGTKIVNLPPLKDGLRCWFTRRPDLCKFLYEKVAEAMVKERSCSADLRYGSTVTSVTKVEGGCFRVSVYPANGAAYELSASVVIGASGGRTPVYEVRNEITIGARCSHYYGLRTSVSSGAR